jgi:hypothetical protein
MGTANPLVGMVVDKGTITAIDDTGYQVSVSGQGVSTLTKYYPMQLELLYANATGTYGWPTGVDIGGQTFAHTGALFANGEPVALSTGMVTDLGETLKTIAK